MTSRKLTLTIDCPDWCDESPVKHLDSGMIYHKHTLGKITAAGGADAIGNLDLVSNVEVTVERFDELDGDRLRHGPVCVRLGADEVYDAAAARELARMLAEVDGVLDGGATQVMAEQDAVARDDA